METLWRPATLGEMIVRSPGNMTGYWNDPEATEKAMRDGWFHTGDLVCQNSDGYLHFHDRRKEIIVRGGSNISPQEAVLYRHPAVREAGVTGVPDAIRGERVVAFVSSRSGRAVTADELIAFVARHLAAYKTPEEIVFLEALPKNAAGKIQRRASRRLGPPRRGAIPQCGSNLALGRKSVRCAGRTFTKRWLAIGRIAEREVFSQIGGALQT
jgi:acyl-CoA synthetase (AMP-forming)/AMP-acid ligase II